jgi:beta-glucosidase
MPNCRSGSDDLPEQRAVAREAAERGIVLLSNRGVLPLSGERLTRVAVIGPAAACTPIQGGGSAGVNPHRSVSVLDGLRAALGPDVVIDHEPGTTNAKHAPLLDASQIRTPDGEPGIAIEYVDVRSGQIVGDEILPTSGLVSVGPPAPVPLAELRIRAHARFTPLVSGPHTFGLMSAGHCVVRLDGAVLLDSTDAPRGGETFFGRGTKEIIAEVMLTAGLEHEISLDVVPVMEPSETVGFLLGCHAPVDPGSMDRAVKAARRADVAIVVVGTSGEWETEGGDRDSLDLPGRQDELVRKVAAANPHSIVVLACGSPVATPWIDDVGACLVAWFGGQEVGDAVAAVLLGEVAPSGRLPVTFPADATQLLDLGFDGATITYHEGTAVGYRRYERDGLSPRFAFGHGLTYTTFEYGSVEVKQRAGAIELACSVRNTGARAGAEVIQVYVRELSPVPELRRLIEFVRCEIEPGQSREVRFVLTSPDLRRWDEERHQWRAPHGPIEVSVGRSAADTRSVTIAEFA